MSVDNTTPEVPMLSDFDPDFIGGAVSLARLLKLYGVEYMEQVDAIWSTDGTDYIVLFASDDETEYALLPVGPAHPHKSLAKALLIHAGGMHAVCHSMARDGIRPVPLTLPQTGWRKIAEKYPAEADVLQSLITDAGTPEDALLVVLRHLAATSHELNAIKADLAEREEVIRTKEEHVTSSAARIEKLMQQYGKWEDLKEQTHLLEMREKYVAEVEARLIKRAQDMELLQEEMNQAVAHLAFRTSRTGIQ
jgi:hypothetical protein